MPRKPEYDDVVVAELLTSEQLLDRTLRMVGAAVTTLEMEVLKSPKEGIHEATARKIKDAATAMEKLMTLQLRLEKQARDKVKKMPASEKLAAAEAFICTRPAQERETTIRRLVTKHKLLAAKDVKGSELSLVPTDADVEALEAEEESN